jgi:CheY-like chemotaxis protein
MVSPAELQRLLLRGIEQLKPPPAMPAYSSRWRQYHYLRRRYLEGASVEEIQQELALGDRQVRREHRAALEALAVAIGVITTSATTLPDMRGAIDAGQAEAGPSEEEEVLGGGALEAELARLDRASVAEPVDLHQAVTSALTLLEVLAARHRVRLEVARPASTPTVMVVRSILQQLLLNLVSALIDVQPESQLVIEGTTAGSDVVLGFHLRPGDMPDDPTRRVSGSLADSDRRLAAARYQAEGQVGRLLVSRGDQNGLRAQLVLPADRATTLLIIDDNPDVGHLFRRYLQGTGFRVVQAANEPDAVALVETTAPGVVILDLMMPIQDGWEIFEQLKRQPPTRSLPVIVCSVLPERDLALSLGVAGFLANCLSQN